MRWKLVQADILESDLKYKVLKCTRWGIPTGRYLAFGPRIKDRPILIGGFDSSKEAMGACEKHWRNEEVELDDVVQ